MKINPLAIFTGLTLATFGALIYVEQQRASGDVFMTPAKVEPRAQRPVELTAMILMLVGSNRGVAVLPDWVLRDLRTNADYVTRPLGPGSITKRLYAATRTEDASRPFPAHSLKLGRSEPVKLQRG